ncbi:MAG: MaoC family dehydratase [Pseudomonadota bacterium]|nr:MaoC family dehydratase [Pseudomonadota bacterium]
MNHEANKLAFTSLNRERYFEDYVEGDVHDLGEVAVDKLEMVKYAKRFDPQAIHIDEEKAKQGPFGGIIASGWYTGSLAMTLFVSHYLSDVSSMASPGFDGLKWLAPVRAGDRLKVKTTVTSTLRSKSKPDRGVVKTFLDIRNQDHVSVMTIDAVNIIALRPIK